jgi:acyl-CoA synthetase (AMP-forming)/AMP-acid ligase II
MRELLTLGQMLAVHARLHGERTGAADLERTLSFARWNARACRLANALLGLGLHKGDRVAVLAYNRLEWLELYAATAKAGLIIVPINFRLVAEEVRYILEHAEAAALVVQDELLRLVEPDPAGLPVAPGRRVHLGGSRTPAGWRGYEELLAAAGEREPEVEVAPEDPWTLLYTSGTTGRPKGVLKSHRAAVLLALVTEIELALHRPDAALLVMPMCHANSLYFFTSFAYCGGASVVYSRPSFDPEHCLRTLATTGATFTSLVPTQYVMLLEVPAAARAGLDLGRVAKLMISSAPARAETKLATMELFRNSGLFELYGSSEAGWVTMLHPDEQLTKLGTVGRECVGSAPIRLLDDERREVPDGAVGELFSCTPYSFDRYWKDPARTALAFDGAWCSVGDMARRDADGYIVLVDRKSNLIISGGENIYPTEVEAVLARHPAVQDVAVVGLPDPLWGERVHAVLVLRPGANIDETAFLDWARPQLAGYKRPRSVSVVGEADLPRTATGKIQHKILRDRLASAAGQGG